MLILYILPKNDHAPVAKVAPDDQTKRSKETV